MNKLYLVLALLFALSACTVGQKCTYTQDGTKISSYVWFTKEVPVDLSKNNCNQTIPGGNMEKVKQVWALAKANPKISAAAVVVIVAIYFLVTQELYERWHT